MLVAKGWELWDPSCRGHGWDEHPSPEDTAPKPLLAGTVRPGWEELNHTGKSRSCCRPRVPTSAVAA